MFNINSLAEGFSHVYDIKKKRVVRAMKNDRTDSWKLRGQRFEVFRPKHENLEPSEWYIPLYALMHPLAVLGWGRKDPAAGLLGNPHKGISSAQIKSSRLTKPSRSASAGGIATLFRRRKQKIEEPEEPDQPWVIE